MMGRTAKRPNASLLHLLLLFLFLGAASPKHHGNPANEIVEIINANRTSNKLPILNNNPGLGCMALQYIMECGGNCSRNNTSSCTPPEVDITEVFAPNCGVELPTIDIISGRLVGCNWNYLDPLEAYAAVLIPDNKTLSILNQKNHTEVGVGLGRTGTNTFQNRNVSSALAETTVVPSGLCDRYPCDDDAMTEASHM
ncbi:hypothetical protein EJ110_NYTH22163 [Nymphaea thermarum]|nr:hypothetical protein EJ110_NYTH22163 [Nymphaea thermarum]